VSTFFKRGRPYANRFSETSKAFSLAEDISEDLYTRSVSADTRSWRTLPNQIFLVRMPLPEGVYNVNLSFLDAGGQNGISQTFRDVLATQFSPYRCPMNWETTI